MSSGETEANVSNVLSSTGSLLTSGSVLAASGAFGAAAASGPLVAMGPYGLALAAAGMIMSAFAGSKAKKRQAQMLREAAARRRAAARLEAAEVGKQGDRVLSAQASAYAFSGVGGPLPLQLRADTQREIAADMYKKIWVGDLEAASIESGAGGLYREAATMPVSGISSAISSLAQGYVDLKKAGAIK